MFDASSGTRSSSRLASLALCLALAGAASMLYYHLGLFIPRSLAASTAKGLGKGYAFGNDFYPIWLTAREWQATRRDPYSAEMTREIQTGLFGRPLDARNPTDPPVDYRQFAYPAFTELLLWPTAALEFSQLRLVLAIVLTMLTAASIWLWMLALQWRVHGPWLAALFLLALCNYPVLEAIFVGQPGLIVGFLLSCSALALKKNRLLLAGTFLGLTLIKPQMTALVVMFLLFWSLSDRRRMRLWAAFLATATLLVSASLCIWPHWLSQWTKVLLGYHRYATPPLVTLILGSTVGAYSGRVVNLGLIVISAALAWWNRRASVDSSDFWITLSLLLAITAIALLPGQAVYDHVILIPGVFLLLRHRRALQNAGRVYRALLALFIVVLFWPWAAAFALVTMRPFLTPAHFDFVFFLPIRTAASLPFAVLALLHFARRINLSAPQESS